MVIVVIKNKMATSDDSVAASSSEVVTNECLQELIEFFASCTTPYRARHFDRRYEVVEKMCLHLLARDYIIQTVDNSDGRLCPHYPAHLYIMESKVNDVGQLRELFKVSKTARSLCRFPVPVILLGDKNICRSSTLSTMFELYGRTGIDWIFSSKERSSEMEELPRQHEKRPSEWALVDRAREFDSQLIGVLGVKLLCDLMVELRKTQYGLTLTSSEKADGNLWYSKYSIACMPYPGCEFFVNYRHKKERTEELHYNWNLSFNDAVISIPSPLSESIGINFKQYKLWNIIEHTQNYLKLILHYLKYETDGVLIHCVAGWDRTPLYISLIRLSLWADGIVHKSLSSREVLYLTLAYDWFIFGHKFEERLRKKEEVLYFCFDFLQYMTSVEYSLNPDTPTTTPPTVEEPFHIDQSCTTNEHNLRSKGGNIKDKFCLFQPSLVGINNRPLVECSSIKLNSCSLRAKKLLTVRELFCKAYNSVIPLAPPTTTQESREGGATGRSGLSGLWEHVTNFLPKS